MLTLAIKYDKIQLYYIVGDKIMEIYLGNDNYFVEGKKNAAIYDLNKGKVYELNETAKKLVKEYTTETNSKLENNLFIKKLINNKIINSKEIKINPTFENNKYEINFAWLELTNACNLKCIHCYGEFGYNDNLNTMKEEDWIKVIDQLYDLGCRNIQLIGGEPMCFRGYKNIVEYLRIKEFRKITIFTNATLISEHDVKFLKENNVRIRFSLYGYNKQIHENITHVKGSFNATINAIKELSRNGVNTSVAVVIMRENEKYINRIKEFIENELKIKYNGYDVIRPSCVNANREHQIKNIDLLSKRYYTSPRFYITKKQFINNHFYNPCLNKKIAITSSGDVIPCIFSRNCVAGNVKNKKLKDLKKEIEKQWMFTKNDIEECKDCEYRYACSDCRPLALGINGNIYSKYPRCCYSPEKGVWQDIKQITKELNES